MSSARSPLASVPIGCCAALAAGIAAARRLQVHPALPLLLVVLGWWLRRDGAHPHPREPGRSPAGRRTLAILLLATGAGAAVERIADARFRASPLPGIARAGATPVVLRGRLADDPIRERGRLRFLLDVETAGEEGSRRPAPGRALLTLRDPEGRARIRAGDFVETTARIRSARNFRNPGSFDYRRHLQKERIHILGSVKSPLLVSRIAPPGRFDPAARLHRLRTRLRVRLDRGLDRPEDADLRGFLAAILLGERRGRAGELDAILRKSGVYHVVSISGLHLSILLGFLRTIARRVPGARRLGPVLASATAGFYVALSGADDPILRCAIAEAWIGVSRSQGRMLSVWDAQALAACALLIANPLRLFDPGFQLSFLATWGLLGGSALAAGLPGGLARKVAPWGASAGAWAATAPAVAAHFTQVSPAGLILNPAAGLFLAFALAGGALLLAVPVEPLADAARLLARGFSALAGATLRIPGSFSRVPPPSPAILLAACALAAAWVGAPRRSPRETAWLGVAGLLLLALVVSPPAAPFPPGRVEFLALDVGQGDAVLVRLPRGEAILVDAGGFGGTDFDIGEKVVVPALLHLGVRRLEVAVLTHAHQDHGGGLPAVLEALPTGEVWFGRMPARAPVLDPVRDAVAARRLRGIHPVRGARRCFGEACLEVLHPPAGYRDGDPPSNDDSLVLRMTYRRASLILTGDVERDAETDLTLRFGERLRAGLLKVAHHGSASSTADAWLSAVRPELAVVSAGEGNPWGHPEAEVLHRLETRGVRVFRTDLDGAVFAFTRGGRWTVRASARTGRDGSGDEPERNRDEREQE